MIFSQVQVHTSKGGLKAIFDFSKYLDWETFWTITALLSIMLGVNLLPIPALDGHVMFFIIRNYQR
jgi:regulator of sigma E protease